MCRVHPNKNPHMPFGIRGVLIEIEHPEVCSGIPDRVSLCIKECNPLCAAGAEAPSRTASFVCHTTPHFGSTSRRDSYSVAAIIHDMGRKVNTQFQCKRDEIGSWGVYFCRSVLSWISRRSEIMVLESKKPWGVRCQRPSKVFWASPCSRNFCSAFSRGAKGSIYFFS